jgi:hypothetical protein
LSNLIKNFDQCQEKKANICDKLQHFFINYIQKKNRSRQASRGRLDGGVITYG